MTFSYNNTLPNPPDDPADDVSGMQVNTQSINSIIKVDHIGFNAANGGYHTVIHLPPQSLPPTVSGIGQLFTETQTIGSVTDQYLFYKSGNGFLMQLTGNVAGTNGYHFINGTILQWGIATMSLSSGSGSGNVSFNAAPNFNFPNNVFNISLTLLAAQSNSSSNNTLSVVNYVSGSLNPPSRTGFSWLFNGTNSSNFTQFYWSAIGN